MINRLLLMSYTHYTSKSAKITLLHLTRLYKRLSIPSITIPPSSQHPRLSLQ